MTRPASTAADRGTYIGLLRPACCTVRRGTTRAYTCACGQRWRLTQDGWIAIGTAADGDRISVRQNQREA